MRKLLLGAAAVALLGAGALAAAYVVTDPALPAGPQAMSHGDAQGFSEIEYGRTMLTVADCAACHTDKDGGGQPFAGGRPIETPFGRIVSSNITPDRETGIGSWTDDDFADALQRGFGKDGHMIYPAMPYPYYTHMTRRDVDAIHAYLKTLKPVHKAVVSDTLPFPLNIRLGMRAWNLLYFREGRFAPDPTHDDVYNRGAYLVTGPEHCGACHTPKTVLGGDEASKLYQGNVIQGWTAPNITGDRRRGLGSWSVDEVVAYLRTGHNAQASSSGPMAEEVDLSSSRMSDGELRAIAVFLKAQPGQEDAGAPVGADTPAMRAGGAIYADSCGSCHRGDGAGVKGLFPTLAGAPVVQQLDPTSLIRVVLQGAKSVSTPTQPTGAAMPSYDWRLDDDEVAAVLTYVRNAWGNRAPSVTADEVGKSRRAFAEADHAAE